MTLRPPIETLTDTLFPSTTLFRSHDHLFRRVDNYNARASWRYLHWPFCNPTFQACSTKRVSPGRFAIAALVSYFGFHSILVPSTQSESITSRSSTCSKAFSPQASQDFALCWSRRSEEHRSALQSIMRIPYDVFC